jgi:hypothetical protein
MSPQLCRFSDAGNDEKDADTSSHALPTGALGIAVDIMVEVFMALLPFVDSTPRAYRLKASNAAPLISTSAGTFPNATLIEQRCAGLTAGSADRMDDSNVLRTFHQRREPRELATAA